MNRRVLALSLSLLLATSGCAYFNTFYHAKKYYGDAQNQDKKARERGEDTGQGNTAKLYTQSIDKCKKLLEKYPDSKWRDDATLLMAKAYYGRGDYEIAEQTLEDFSKQFPQSDLRPDAEYWQGLTAFALEDYSEARRIWTSLLEAYPKFKDAETVHYELERTYHEEGNTDLAIQACRDYLKEYPNGEDVAKVQIDLARYLLDTDEPAEAQTVAIRATKTAHNDLDRVQGQLLLGEAYGDQDEWDQALQVYVDAAILLDPDVYKGRMTEEQRDAMLRAQRQQAVEDSVARVEGKPIARPQNQNRYNRVQRDLRDPKQRLLAQVMLSEGQALAKLNRPKDAIIAFEQVLREFPRSSYSAEAEYRIGYTYEVLMEDFDRAQRAYSDVPNQGVSAFRDEALRRARNLDTVKSLLAESATDTLSEATTAAAEAKFMRAELYLFQQEKPEKALEEYEAIETEFAGTDYAAKAGLATAWLLQHSMDDSLASRQKYEEVAAAYPNTEYGRRAIQWLQGPIADPEPVEFAGPTLAELTDPLNLAVVAPDTATGGGGAGTALAAVAVASEVSSPTSPPPPVQTPSPNPGAGGGAASLGAAMAATGTSSPGAGAAAAAPGSGVNPGAVVPGSDPGSMPAGGATDLVAGAAAAGAGLGAAATSSTASAGLNPAAVPPPEGAAVAAGGGVNPMQPVPVGPPTDRVQGHLMEVPRGLYLDPLAVPAAEPPASVDAGPSVQGGGTSSPASSRTAPTRPRPSPGAIPGLEPPPVSPGPAPTPAAVPPPAPKPADTQKNAGGEQKAGGQKEADSQKSTGTQRKENPRANVPRRETPPRNVSPQRQAPPKEDSSKKEGGGGDKEGDKKSSGDKGAPPDSSSGDRS